MAAKTKPRNWISITGFRPCAAMPTDRPAIMVSASGVSITRLKPKASRRPRVARNTPPLTPTSSPSTTTSPSSRIARCRARLTASSRAYFFASFMALPSRAARRALQQHLALLRQGRRPAGVDMVDDRLHRLLAGALEGLHRTLHPGLALADQRLLALLVPVFLAGQ